MDDVAVLGALHLHRKAFVKVAEPDGLIGASLGAHDIVVVRPDRIVYAVGPTAADQLTHGDRMRPVQA